MSMHDSKASFMAALARYIGQEYLSQAQIILDDDTTFTQLKFDIADEIVTELLIEKHFGQPYWICNEWPTTIGGLWPLIGDG